MKTKMILLVAIALCACNINNPETPSNPSSSGSGNSGSTVTKPQAGFSVKVVQPLSVEITNKYNETGVKYTWNFGDNTNETGATPAKHRYKTKGVYKITLTAKNSAGETSVSKNVTIEEPTRCYVEGYAIWGIPTNNMYYRCRLTDNYNMYATNYATTSWYLFSSANLPQVIKFTTAPEVEKFNNKGYLLWLEKSNSKSGDGTLVKKWTITNAQLWQEFSEALTGEDDGKNEMVTIMFIWK